MWWLVLLGFVVVTAVATILVRRLGTKEGIQLTSTLVATASTVVLGVFAWQQMEYTNRAQATQHTAQWGELRNVMWAVLDLYPPSGIDALRALPTDQRLAWLRQVRRLLDSAIGNAVLIECEECLAHWRNAISSAKTSFDVLAMAPDEERAFFASVKGIHADVLFVWQKLVLESDEVSPTGGRPE